MKVYDVVFVGRDGREESVATGIRDRAAAVAVARRAAAERQVGRMVDSWTKPVPNCVLLRSRHVQGPEGGQPLDAAA